MGKGRFEAFTDGVIAIIITIMVLELKAPDRADFQAIWALRGVFLSYVMSFIYIGIYWNNHHHMLHATTRVSGGALWANLHLLFWLSLVPFVTGWMDDKHYEAVPTATYGVVLLMAAIAYTILQTVLTRQRDHNKALADAIKHDGKGKLSLVLYLTAIPLAFYSSWIAIAIYIIVALIWLVPDPRIERVLADLDSAPSHR